MSKDNNKRISVFSILIFVLCGILAIYTVWSFISVTTYIGEMFEYGSISASENFFDILSYYMTNCGIYVVYICILLGIWWISDKKMVTSKAKAAPAPAISTEEKAAPEAKAEVKEAGDDKPTTGASEEK